MAIFRFLKMAAAAILDFGNFKFLTIGTVERVKLHHHAKFRRNRSNRGWDMAILRFSRWRPPPSWILPLSRTPSWIFCFSGINTDVSVENVKATSDLSVPVGCLCRCGQLFVHMSSYCWYSGAQTGEPCLSYSQYRYGRLWYFTWLQCLVLSVCQLSSLFLFSSLSVLCPALTRRRLLPLLKVKIVGPKCVYFIVWFLVTIRLQSFT